MNLLCACPDVEQLPEVLSKIRGCRFDAFRSNRSTFQTSLDNYIRSL